MKKLIALIVTLLSVVTMRAEMQMRVYTNVADMVANASPLSLNKGVRTMGYYQPNDGGGADYWATNTAANTNLGGRFQSALTPAMSFGLLPDPSGRINVQKFGAKCDATSDDSAAIYAAMQWAGPGGHIRIPGRSKFNVTVATNSLIVFEGDGADMDYHTTATTYPPTSYWAPYDPTKPVIKIGNDTASVRGISIHDATLYGASVGNVGIEFGGGAIESLNHNVSVWNFRTNVVMRGGLNYPATLIFFNEYLFQQDTTHDNTRGIYAIMPLNQSSYTTAMWFANGHVVGPSSMTNAFSVEVDGTLIGMANSWLDMADGHALKFSQTYSGTLAPYIECSQVHFDGISPTGVAIDASGLPYPAFEIPVTSSWIRGHATINGKIKLPSGTLYDTEPGELHIPYSSSANYLQVSGALILRSTPGGFNQDVQIYRSGTLGVFENKVGEIRAYANGNYSITSTNGGVHIYSKADSTYLHEGNVTLDAGRTLAIGTIGVIGNSGNNITLSAGTGGILSLNGDTVNLNPVTALNIGGGTSHSANINDADIYLYNGRGMLAKDINGNYQNFLSPSGTNLVLVNNLMGRLDLFANHASYGIIRFGSGGLDRWHLDISGSLLPQSTYDIGTSGARAGTGYFTALNITGGDVQTLLNAKVGTSRSIATSSPLQGGGDLSADRTLSIQTASGSQAGAISSADWNTFNNKVSTTRSISTTSPLLGGGDFSANRTFSIQQATTSQDGYLSSVDWNTFNNKVSTTRTIATSGSLTGGGDLSANRTLSLVGDSSSPGVSKYYGTDAFGTKGFYGLPGGGGGGATANPTLNFVPFLSAANIFADSSIEQSGTHVLTYHHTGAGTSSWLFDNGSVTMDGNIGEFQFNGVGTSDPVASKGFKVRNTTAALVGAQQQNSPTITWEGQGWSTGSSASKSVKFGGYISVAGGSNPTGMFTLESVIGVASPTTVFGISSASGWGGLGTKYFTDDGTFHAIPSTVAPTRAVNTANSLTGGGDLSADRTLSLVNDAGSPGNNKYYGTGPGGAKGYFSFPVAGVDELFASGNCVTTDGTTPVQLLQFTGGRSFAFEVTIIADWNSGASYGAYTFKQRGMLKNIGPGFSGIVSLEAVPFTLNDNLTPVSVSVSGVAATQGGLKINVVGEAGKSVTWAGSVRYTSL